jgi:putative ABC transport system substrate-binding protein
MRRREFIAGLGSAAVWPLAARGQQAVVPVIGLLQIGAPSSWDFTGFRQGLRDMGYVEGQNLAIDVRWANNDPHRLPGLAADMVHRQVRVIVAFGSVEAASAAKAVTNTIPIVFGFGSDPVQQGIVASLNRPGGNVTGMTALGTKLVGKQLGMLHELLPQASHFGLLQGPKSAVQELIAKDAQAAASVIGGTIEILTASTSGRRRGRFRSFSRISTTRSAPASLRACPAPEGISPA